MILYGNRNCLKYFLFYYVITFHKNNSSYILIHIRTICSILVTLCWSILVLLYIVSHKQIVLHVAVKSKSLHNDQYISVHQNEEPQMCLFHFSNTSYHHIRVGRTTYNTNFLTLTAYWKSAACVTDLSDSLFLYFNQADFIKLIADRIILFKKIRI